MFYLKLPIYLYRGYFNRMRSMRNLNCSLFIIHCSLNRGLCPRNINCSFFIIHCSLNRGLCPRNINCSLFIIHYSLFILNKRQRTSFKMNFVIRQSAHAELELTGAKKRKVKIPKERAMLVIRHNPRKRSRL